MIGLTVPAPAESCTDAETPPEWKGGMALDPDDPRPPYVQVAQALAATAALPDEVARV